MPGETVSKPVAETANLPFDGEKMKDVMIDFEAFGNGKNACVCQVGAMKFDRHTGEIGAAFKANIDARTSQASGGEFDADTVYWWLSQSREAIDAITAPDLISIQTAMELLNSFLADAEAIWSHATYDFVILTETLKRLGIKPRFSFRAARDIRTLVDLAQVDTKKGRERKGIHHDALADCEYQIGYCVEALNKLAVWK